MPRHLLFLFFVTVTSLAASRVSADMLRLAIETRAFGTTTAELPVPDLPPNAVTQRATTMRIGKDNLFFSLHVQFQRAAAGAPLLVRYRVTMTEQLPDGQVRTVDELDTDFVPVAAALSWQLTSPTQQLRLTPQLVRDTRSAHQSGPAPLLPVVPKRASTPGALSSHSLQFIRK